MPKGMLFFVLFFSMLTMTSCKKQPKKVSTTGKQAWNMLDSLKLYQAKYFDIPTPVGYSLLDAYCKDKVFGGLDDVYTKGLCYTGKLTVEDAVTFYRQSMERLGWDIRDLSSEHEGLLFCKKSGKSCALSIRSDSNKGGTYRKSRVYIFLQNDSDEMSYETRDINSKQLHLTL